MNPLSAHMLGFMLDFRSIPPFQDGLAEKRQMYQKIFRKSKDMAKKNSSFQICMVFFWPDGNLKYNDGNLIFLATVFD